MLFRSDVVFAEVPLTEHAARHYRLGVLVAALAEVAAQVLAVAQSLDVVWGGEGSNRGGSELDTKWPPW